VFEGKNLNGYGYRIFKDNNFLHKVVVGLGMKAFSNMSPFVKKMLRKGAIKSD
jgi:hypothetical protein